MIENNFRIVHIIFFQIFCVIICKAEWQLIYDRFYEPSIDLSSSSWDFSASCTSQISCSSSLYSCTANANTMLRLNTDCKSMNSDFHNLTPHFQLKYIYDIYILGVKHSSSHTFYLYADSNQIYSFTYSEGDAIYNKKMCRNTFDTDSNFLYKTRVETFDHDGSNVNLKFCTTISDNNYNIGIRNMQLYQNSCDAKCKKCSSESFCTDCYYGTASGGNCSDCPNNTLFIDITKSSCQQECDSNKVPDQNNICQTDPNISQYDKYFDSNSFTSYGDWEFIADPVFYSLLSKDRILSCSSKSYVGPYGANEAMQLKLTLVNTVQYIRFRVTFFLQDWADDTSIQILWNDIPIDLIYQSSSIIYSQASTIILSDTFGCDKRVRIEKLFTNTQINSKLTFKGNMQVELNQLWGFRDVYIDYGVCEKNCDLCASATKCQTCSGSRKNHKGKCLNSCPLYSAQSGSVCNDFDDDLEYSKYYIKAFYDTSTTDLDAASVMGTFSTIGSNNLKSGGAVFSYLPYKRVFGGSFVWYNARVYRNITNIKPHYQYKLKMEIVLGEEAGNFYYNFTGSSNNQIVETGGGGWWGTQSLPPPANHSNLWGQTDDEYQYSIDQIIPHSSNYLNFEMRYDCQQNNPQDGFAAISNFYLIFYYCVPMCPACTGPNIGDCTWGSTYDSTTMQQTTPGGPITCKDHYYLFTDELAVTYTCLQCATNCDVCTSATQCTTCFTDFYLMNGLCECMGGTYLSSATTCSDCNSLCLTCRGPNIDNCLSCHESQFRMLNKNECVCKPYYSLQIDGTCQPVCGDMMVMPGEDCDDGNTIEYDGCHQCQFQCEQNCQICLFGKCAICSDGYYLNPQTNLCQSKCGDSIISGVEQCEDGNLVPYDGCHQCNFQCQNECTDCQNGICFACQSGWMMNPLKYFCEPYCGDGIVDGSEECDDGNQQPFDGCHNCKYSCHNKCSHCARGQCLLCASGYQLEKTSQLCISICGDQYRTETEQCDDGNLIPYDGCYQCEFQCQLECTNCSYGKCIECDIGWFLNEYNNECEVVFGDGVVIKDFEFCDDNNECTNDGCYGGQQQCQIGCNRCYLENCLQCDSLWYLDQGICYPKCGDGIIVIGQEECDDGNYVQFDGCFNCKFQSQLECLESQYGVCQECKQGWSLNYQNVCQEDYFNNSYILEIQEGCLEVFQDNCQLCQVGWVLNQFKGKCEPICGDYTINEYEECDNDDINQCFECKFICHPECKDCRYGKCYECDIGFTLINNICLSLCGDSIIKQLEQCEDENLNPFDGCYQCQLQCEEHCLTCIQGICQQCDNSTGYYLDNYGKCQSKCGDNIIAGTEECDIKEIYCSHNCLLYIVNNCLIHEIDGCKQCQNGYQLQNGFCEPICGDLIQVEGEQCDDQIAECVNCQLQCQTECIDCIGQGICIKCDEENGFYLDYSGLCVSKCSDLIVSQNETCDDQNINCSQCQWHCDSQCQFCKEGHCQSCNSGYYLDYNLQQCTPICGDGIITGIEQCEDNNDVPFDGCYNCQYSCQKECDSCIFGVCQSCNEFGWEYNQVNGSCDPICGDYYIVGNEQCDDGNVIPYDGCFECKVQCQEPCTSCLIGKCWECATPGWELDIFNMCVAICGDGLTVGDEHCDDGNNIRYDGCYECHFECQEQCTDCRFESCFDCTVGWKLNNYECESICGDQLVVVGEDCDDGNEIPNDGCFECKYQCDIMCLECEMGLCVTCQTGWQVNSLGICDPICGDGIVQAGFEECDDGNDTEFDGCYKCLYSCHEACTNCFEGKCLECNTIGWTPWNGICRPICGDGIIIQPEQCDDMNLIPHDGCNNCLFECHEKCIDCKEGICIRCDLGWYEYADQCISHCGDGIYVTENEDCDDGNNQDQDGCDSECQVETNWICANKQSQPSTCHFNVPPNIVARILEAIDEITVVQITIDQKVKLSSSALELNINQPKQYLELSILSQSKQHYEITIQQIQGISNVSADVKYNVTIKFLASMYRPDLEIKVSQEYVVNDYNQPILNNQVILQLESPELISKSEIQSAESASQFTETVVYTLIGVAGISVLTGSMGMLQNLLDQIQFLSYIKYVNIKFPRNLNIYFETFKLVSLGPVLRLLKIDQLLIGINGGDVPYIEPAAKFSQDNINAYFLGNFQTFLFCLFTGYGGYLLSKWVSIILYKLGAFQMSKIGKTVSKAILSVRQSLNKLQKGFFCSGLLRILMANYYDISFATLIQLSNWNLENINFAINSFLALFFFVGQFYVMYKMLAQTTKIIKASSYVKKKKFDALFDGVNQNQLTFWSLQFNSIQMIKKLAFLVIITLFQDQGGIQSILVGFISSLFIVYLILCHPLENKYEYYKLLISESIVSFNTLTFLFYSYQKETKLQYESLLLLGWIHIATFSGSLCSSLGFDLWQQCEILYKKMKGMWQKKKEEESIILFY